MKRFLTILLFLPFLTRADINVRTYGAVGNGVTDDTRAINIALLAAQAKGQSIYFPAGTYLCNTIDGQGNILSLNISGLKNIRLYGDSTKGEARITTSKTSISTLLYIYSYAPASGLRIENIFFESTHGIMTWITSAIFLQGTAGQNIQQATITHCRFEGFSDAIQGQGITGWHILRNKFGSPKGHDNAQSNTIPAVYIWLFDNQNGDCENVRIMDNEAEGYTGPGPVGTLFSKRPLDGFVYGVAYGLLISGNRTANFGEEHYCLQPLRTGYSGNAAILIQNNTIDCSLPPGCMDGALPHKDNYAIRCDANNSIITRNTISNYTYGIMVRLQGYSNLSPITQYVISGNTLYEGQDSTIYAPVSAISVAGSLVNTVSGLRITGNTVYGRTGIVVYNIAAAVLQNNNVLNQ